MFEKMIHDMGEDWSQSDRALNAVWNEYCVSPWDCWCLNSHKEAPILVHLVPYCITMYHC